VPRHDAPRMPPDNDPTPCRQIEKHYTTKSFSPYKSYLVKNSIMPSRSPLTFPGRGCPPSPDRPVYPTTSQYACHELNSPYKVSLYLSCCSQSLVNGSWRSVLPASFVLSSRSVCVVTQIGIKRCDPHHALSAPVLSHCTQQVTRSGIPLPIFLAAK
jgi:hypothetical protein